MRKGLKLLLIMLMALAGMIMMCSCDPVLSLYPEYSYTDFEMNLGEKLPTEIDDYIDFSKLEPEEEKFVRENVELLFDGSPKMTKKFGKAGDHTLTINYCGRQYRRYNITITDKVPPYFTKNEDLYTFVGLDISDELQELMFEAEDNSGECELEVVKAKVDFEKAGEYKVTAKATDPSGNVTTEEAHVIVQEPKYGAKGTYVYVSIDHQELTYFVDGEVVLATPVVTGNSWGHNTPKGTFRINNKGRNITLKGREDNGDEYESFVRYWMPFLGSSYGLHDADWRGRFGGTIYQGGGSHGCVNMPIPMAAELYDMIEIGTPVLIY